MPRDGLQQYSPPPGTHGITNYTVESTKYNNFVDDITADLNAPRPISSGGTGANNAADAMNNLGGELARQLIANYDADPFQAGSFYSAAGATSAPSANAFTGICYVSGVSPALTDLFIEARDQSTGVLWVRQKKAGVWGAWQVPAGVASGPTPPTGVSANTLWWDPNRGKLFIYYKDVDSSQWVEAVAVPDVDPNTFVEINGDTMFGPLILNADPTVAKGAATKQYVDALSSAAGSVVAYSIQTPTPAQQTIARQNIYAAPFDAMAYSGMQINGSMEVSQELGGTGRTTDGYICDGWRFDRTNIGYNAATWAADTTTPPGFAKFLALNITTGASMGASDYAVLSQFIEGCRVARLAWGTASAQPITLGFWTSHHRTGTYSVMIKFSNTRSYATTYTQNAADTPEYKTVTIPGDTTGGWTKDNTAGMTIMFAVGCGSTYTASAANAWQAGHYFAAPGQINGVAATSDVFRITGVVVLPGIEAPSAARSPLIMRPYDQELALCERQLRVITPEGAGFTVGPSAYFAVRHRGLRATPTVRALDALVLTSGGANFSQSAPDAAIWGNVTDYGTYRFSSFTGLPASALIFTAVGANANRVMFDARL